MNENNSINQFTLHNLKILKKYYIDLNDNSKKAEIRINDRQYKKGDLIQFTVLNDDYEVIFQPVSKFRITHILDFKQGLKENYVCLSLEKIKG